MAAKAKIPYKIVVSGRQSKIDPAKTYKVWNKELDRTPMLSPMEGSKVLSHFKNRTAIFELGGTDYRSFPS